MPSSEPTLGVNDLQSQFPEIATEAYGWDPSTVTAGSNQKKEWRCNLGHNYFASISHRSNGTGCSICSNKQILIGFNDLQSKFPEIAKQAYGWDPTTVFASSNKKRQWRCDQGHTWEAVVSKRTLGRGCPICANRVLLVGFNDLKTKFPYIADQADGWDPSLTIAGTAQKKSWKCELGHIWEATVSNRSFSNTGCPVCANLKLLAGFNDLKTRYPEIAQEAETVAAMGLSTAEIAFYDALANNQSAQDLMGDEVLKEMARELANKLRGNLSIDWQYKENVRAKLRTMIKALLKRYK